MEQTKTAQKRRDLGFFMSFSSEAEEEEFGFTRKAVKTPEGYLDAVAVATGAGVYTYQTDDGREIRELRPPEEVFKRESIDSLRKKIITDDHPDEAVDSENVGEFQAGHIGDNIQSDGMNLSISLMITHADAVAHAESGKRALSCGYTADIEMTGGVWQGVQYDAIQRNIIYNHVSLVDRGRAGDKARIRFDSSQIKIKNSKQTDRRDGQNKQEPNNMAIKKYMCDGVEQEADDATIAYVKKQDKAVGVLTTEVEKETKRADTAEGELKTQKEEFSALQAKFDTSEENLKKAEAGKLDDAAIQKKVDEKLLLVKTADNFEVKLKGDESDLEIKTAVVKTAFPDAKLDGKDEVYISTRFDIAVEDFKKDKADDAQGRVDLGDTGGGSVEQKRDKARQDRSKKRTDAWKVEDK